MSTALAVMTAFVATLIRRNVRPLFRPWFTDDEGAHGARYLGAVIGCPQAAPYVDLYVTPAGDLLTRYGNAEPAYGAFSIEVVREMGDQAPTHYRLALALADRRARDRNAYVPAAYEVKAKPAEGSAPEWEEEPNSGMFEAVPPGR